MMCAKIVADKIIPSLKAQELSFETNMSEILEKYFSKADQIAEQYANNHKNNNNSDNVSS